MSSKRRLLYLAAFAGLAALVGAFLWSLHAANRLADLREQVRKEMVAAHLDTRRQPLLHSLLGEAIRLAPDDAEFRGMRAVVRVGDGDLPGAREDIERGAKTLANDFLLCMVDEAAGVAQEHVEACYTTLIPAYREQARGFIEGGRTMKDILAWMGYVRLLFMARSPEAEAALQQVPENAPTRELLVNFDRQLWLKSIMRQRRPTPSAQ